MPKPLVTVIMPAYNRGAYISKAIESVLKQSYPYWRQSKTKGLREQPISRILRSPTRAQ